MAGKAVAPYLRLGSLVETFDLGDDWDNEIGQLGAYCGGNTFTVTLLDGRRRDLLIDHIRPAMGQGLPGEDGDAESFDFVIGPSTDHGAIADALSQNLFQKGFSVMRLVPDLEALQDTMKELAEMSENGRLARLPEEVEEHYLGVGATAKVCWVEATPEGVESGIPAYLEYCDDILSNIGAVLQPQLEDIIGTRISERTPGLVSVSLDEEEQDEYPFPLASDEILGEFLQTYRRQVLKAQLFLGPGSPSLSLKNKNPTKCAQFPVNVEDGVNLVGKPGTLVVYRTDCFGLEAEYKEETVSLTASYLKLHKGLVLDSIVGDPDALVSGVEGPARPSQDFNCNVVACATRLAANWDEPEWLYAGLAMATDAASKIPLCRYDVDIYWAPNPDSFEPWQHYNKHISVQEGAEMFDNKHFEISNMEAKGMDPRQRHILEVGAKCLYCIGITKKMTNRQVYHGGAVVGTDGFEWPQVPKGDLGACGGTSNALAITANRFNFVFNMRGPSFFCDTACSSSLYGSHLGKFCIMERRWDPLEWFLCMGTQLYLLPGGFSGGCASHMLSAHARCFTFNASADGYMKGDGNNAMILKHGNHEMDRYCIFRGSNCNQDGRSASLTAPNGPAQEQCIIGAMREAGCLPPESTSWDAHGTGTSLGDPIEVGAVKKVQIKYKRKEPLLLTTIKSNIGHLEGGAAISGVLKCILETSKAKCLPTVGFRTLNPHLEHSLFEAIFETECGHFPGEQGHAQISSFGFGGSNAHGMFWGRNLGHEQDVFRDFMKKLKEAPPPQVVVLGKNPEDWESDLPDSIGHPGSKYTVTFDMEDPYDQPLRYIQEGGFEVKSKKKKRKMRKVIGPDGEELDEEEEIPEEEGGGEVSSDEEEAGVVEADEDEDAYFDISGNFNEWLGDRMMAGAIPGLWVTSVEVPEDGELEFRFVKNGDDNMNYCPATDHCTKKTAKIIGPTKERNVWTVKGKPETEVQIEFFQKKERCSIVWLKCRD